MTKQLILRLSGQASGNIPWVLWQPHDGKGGPEQNNLQDSDGIVPGVLDQDELEQGALAPGAVGPGGHAQAALDRGVFDQGVLDQGVLDHADQLSELAAYSRDAKVTVLVSSTEIGFHVLDLPPGSKRHLAQVVPYALEESLAQDIEELHFAWKTDAWAAGGRAGSRRQAEGATLVESDAEQGLPVVVVAKHQVQTWLDWLANAGIRAHALIPDLFILPLNQDEWSAMSLDHEIVVRHGRWRGFAIEQSLFAELSGLFSDAMAPPSRIRCWGPLEWGQAPAPLAPAAGYTDPYSALMLARQLSTKQGINLLQGDFAPQRERRTSIGVWRWPAVAAVALLALLFVDKGLYIWQLNQQATQLNTEIEQRYRQTFSAETRVVNVRAQLNQHLARLQGGGQQGQLLALLSQLSNAFAGAPLQVTLLSFDASRNELRIHATGADFATFERFQQLVKEQDLEVEPGQLNARQGRIAGTMTVRGGR